MPWPNDGDLNYSLVVKAYVDVADAANAAAVATETARAEAAEAAFAGSNVSSVNGHTGAVTLAASDVGAQPVDSDLTAIAALTTTAFGRSVLTQATAAALRALQSLGTAALSDNENFDLAGAAANAQAASQPLDSDLTAIAALATTSYGRGLLILANQAALLSAVGAIPTSQVTGLDAALALKAPLANPTLTGTVTVPSPVNATDAVTKGYADGLATGLQVKAAVACGSTANLTLSGEQTIDGVTTSASRVLVKDQTTQSANGIYVSAAGAWTRSTDCDQSAEFNNAYVLINGGNHAGDSYVQQTANPTVGTSPIVWVIFDSAVGLERIANKGVASGYAGLDTGALVPAAQLPVDTDSTMAANSDTKIATQKATKTALALKAPLASPTFTGTVTIPTGASITAPTGLVKGDVGLGNVDNTADSAKTFNASAITAGTLPVARGGTGATAATGSGNVVLATSPALATATATADPTTALGLATKQYVDNAIASLDVKPDVAYAATSALPANTYANGSSGVGATLTGNVNGPLIIDGVTILAAQAGERVLVAGEATASRNGWYTITQVGVVAISPYILTRATESDEATEIGAGYLTGVVAPNTVTAGSANNGKIFVSVAPDPFTVGTSNLTFSTVGNTYSAGNGLTLSGTAFSIDPAITVDKTTVQTLTNKTLTAPVLSSPTGLAAADIPSLDASKITSGVVATARLGSGTPTSTTVLLGNSSWGAVPADPLAAVLYRQQYK